jgi:hypothetical protein
VPAASGHRLTAGQRALQQPGRIGQVCQIFRRRPGRADGGRAVADLPAPLPVAGDRLRPAARRGRVVDLVLARPAEPDRSDQPGRRRFADRVDEKAEPAEPGPTRSFGQV